LVTPRVLEIEFESVLFGHLNHCSTQDVGISLGNKESWMGSGHRPVPGCADAMPVPIATAAALRLWQSQFS
jgi:hypothetical protein